MVAKSDTGISEFAEYNCPCGGAQINRWPADHSSLGGTKRGQGLSNLSLPLLPLQVSSLNTTGTVCPRHIP